MSESKKTNDLWLEHKKLQGRKVFHRIMCLGEGICLT